MVQHATEGPLVTVIIATLADTARASHLARAVESVLSLDVPALPLVVVNGEGFDRAVIGAIEHLGATVVHVRDTGVSNARRHGRAQVHTPFFGFLDDDDELLPTAGSGRISHFSNPDVDIVVTNGYAVLPNGEERPFRRMPPESNDDAYTILQENWLASAAAFFRTAAITASDFDGLPNVMEWTVLGFRLALKHEFVHSAALTYRIHADAPNRATETRRYGEDEPAVLTQLKAYTRRPELLRRLDEKIRSAHHSVADRSSREGSMSSAWRHHLLSLRGAGFLRYLGFTRHLVARHCRMLSWRAGKGGDRRRHGRH